MWKTQHHTHYSTAMLESTGSGDFSTLENSVPTQLDSTELELYFKETYPLQYLVLRKKFEKKMKKFIKMQEELPLIIL